MERRCPDAATPRLVDLRPLPRRSHGAEQRAWLRRLTRLPTGTYVVLLHNGSSDEVQEAVLASIGSPDTVYRYSSAVEGFAADLTTEQVKQLQADPAVLMVRPNTLAPAGPGCPGIGLRHRARPSGPPSARTPARVSSSESSTPGSGPRTRPSRQRRWMQSGGGRRTRRTQAPVPPTASAGPSGACNGKVIGAQYFVDGFGADRIAAAEYLSPRDGTGHGSHVAATAAGNSGVAVTIGKQSFGRVTGVAPGAALSIYKACWAAPDPSDDGCTSADTVAAIDQAVSDGVDVLNLSLSDSDLDSVDPVEIALLNAAADGISVMTSAGDGGPAAATVAHPGPWGTTVAASTGLTYPGRVVLGDGRTFRGSMASSAPIPRARLVYAGDASAPGADPAGAAFCLTGTLDAAKVDDAIVVCDRGVNGRIAKSETVDQAGGRAMILTNTGPGSIATDIHAVPTVHLAAAAGRACQGLPRRHTEADGCPRTHRAGPGIGADRTVLRPRAGRRRRPRRREAGPRRTGRQHPRGRVASRRPRQALGPVVRYVGGLCPGRRRRGRRTSDPPRLVAGGGEVGPDDNGRAARRLQHAGPRCRGAACSLRPRPGARLRREAGRVVALPAWTRRLVAGRLRGREPPARRQQPQPRLDLGRQPGRRAAGATYGDERRCVGRDVYRCRHRAAGSCGPGRAIDAVARARGVGVVPGGLQRAECGRLRRRHGRHASLDRIGRPCRVEPGRGPPRHRAHGRRACGVRSLGVGPPGR